MTSQLYPGNRLRVRERPRLQIRQTMTEEWLPRLPSSLHMHEHTYTCISTHMCTLPQKRTHTNRKRIGSNKATFSREYFCVYVHAFVCMHVHAHVGCACVFGVNMCVLVCICVGKCVCMYMNILGYMYVHMRGGWRSRVSFQYLPSLPTLCSESGSVSH